jgi:NADH:ubiquinone oxidoreductase subunit 4 (subunit M)
VPLAIIILVLGIYPSFLLNVMTSSVNHLVSLIAQNGSAAALLQ